MVDDTESRAVASAAAGYAVEEIYILFELTVDGASSTVYRQGAPLRRHWGKQ